MINSIQTVNNRTKYNKSFGVTTHLPIPIKGEVRTAGVDLMQQLDSTANIWKALIMHQTPNPKFTLNEVAVGKLPNKEGEIYQISREKGIFHLDNEHNIGIFTDLRDPKKIIGMTIPLSDTDRIFRLLEREGTLVEGICKDSDYFQRKIAPNGDIIEEYAYVDGKSNYNYPQAQKQITK